MKSIERLRDSSHLDDSKWTLATGEVVTTFNSKPNDPAAVNWGEQWRNMADEIEAEIDRDYIRLPVDGDGEALRVGDEVWFHDDEPGALPYVVCGYGTMREGGADVFLNHRDEGWAPTSVTRPDVLVHRKPDPLNDLLGDVSGGVFGYPRDRIARYLEDNHSIGEAVLLDVRDRLRVMAEGGYD